MRNAEGSFGACSAIGKNDVPNLFPAFPLIEEEEEVLIQLELEWNCCERERHFGAAVKQRFQAAVTKGEAGNCVQHMTGGGGKGSGRSSDWVTVNTRPDGTRQERHTKIEGLFLDVPPGTPQQTLRNQQAARVKNSQLLLMMQQHPMLLSH